MKNYVRLAIAAVVVLLIPGAAAVSEAQPKPNTTKVAPESFSNKATIDKKTPPKAGIKISDEDTADAILGSALEHMYDQGAEFWHVGEWNHCINMFKVVEQGDPHNVQTFSEAAWLLWSTDRNDEAIAQLKEGLENNKDNFYMWDELGSHYWIRLKDAASALPYFQKAITFKSPWPTYHNLAFCYQKLNRWQEAVDTWKASTKFGDDRVAPIKLKQAEAHLATMKK